MTTSPTVGGKKVVQRKYAISVAETTVALIDYTLIPSLIFGGCCTNAWSLEMLLKQGSSLGSALTFLQMTFIAAQALPSFVTFQTKERHPTWLPHVKPRAVPLSTWLAQVLLLVCMSLLNNWAFAFRVPLTVQIVVRSSGLAVSMLFGYFVLYKTYNRTQIMAVAMVTSGVILATLSGPSSSSHVLKTDDIQRYSMGISMLVLASLLTGYYGMLQEKTYARYGPHWREGVFYTHLFSLPTFLFLRSDVQRGISSLSRSSNGKLGGIPYSYLVLVLNLVTQLLCTSSVNKLTSYFTKALMTTPQKVSSVTTNLVLTTRKALSLCISVWWFGNGWDANLGLGASMVFLGTILYATFGSRGDDAHEKKDKVD